MRRLMAVAVVLGVGTVACDSRGMVGPGGQTARPQQAVILAGHGHFSFAAPLASPTPPNGTFNPRVSPVVEVCRITVAGCPIVATFTLESGPLGQVVTVDQQSEVYKAAWLLDGSMPNGDYRISVRGASSNVTNTFLGSVDVSIIPPSASATSLPSFPNNSPLTIRFRIEEGALCEADECVETSLDETGGKVTLEDSLAGAYFPPGSIPDEVGHVNVIIERFTDRSEPCLPTNHPQYEACYRYRTEPHVTFEVPVTIGICLDPAAQSFESELELQKWDEVNPNTLVSLPRTSVDFLDCDGFQVSAAPQGAMGRLAGAASKLFSPLGRALSPDALHAAVISPYGGKLSDFSRIGWVRPLRMSAAPAPSSFALSSTSTPPMDVRVTSTLTGAPVAGIPVAWTTSGIAKAFPAVTTSDADGRTATMWSLGGTGHFTLTATAGNPKPGWPGRAGSWGTVQFEKDVLPPPPVVYHATFLQPIGASSTGSTSWLSSATPSVAICRLANGVCIQTVTAFASTTKSVTSNSFQVTWTAPAALPLGMYRIIVTNQSVMMGSVDLQAVSTASDLRNAKFQVGKSLLIKFTIEP